MKSLKGIDYKQKAHFQIKSQCDFQTEIILNILRLCTNTSVAILDVWRMTIRVEWDRQEIIQRYKSL